MNYANTFMIFLSINWVDVARFQRYSDVVTLPTVLQTE